MRASCSLLEKLIGCLMAQVVVYFLEVIKVDENHAALSIGTHQVTEHMGSYGPIWEASEGIAIRKTFILRMLGQIDIQASQTV